MTKTSKVAGFNLACKWKRKYRAGLGRRLVYSDEFRVRGQLSSYKKRFGIEQMFRDFKIGGYNLESTNASGQRLLALILIITLAYTAATIQGEKSNEWAYKIRRRVKESNR